MKIVLSWINDDDENSLSSQSKKNLFFQLWSSSFLLNKKMRLTICCFRQDQTLKIVQSVRQTVWRVVKKNDFDQEYSRNSFERETTIIPDNQSIEFQEFSLTTTILISIKKISIYDPNHHYGRFIKIQNEIKSNALWSKMQPRKMQINPPDFCRFSFEKKIFIKMSITMMFFNTHPSMRLEIKFMT